MTRCRLPDEVFRGRFCTACGAELVRKTYPSGAQEWRAAYEKRRFCSPKCRGDRDRAQSAKTTERLRSRVLTSHETSRLYASKLVPVGPCDTCGRPYARKGPGRSEVHHRDRNPLNNAAENIVRLCKRCHVLEHHGPRLPCCVDGCGAPSRTKGMCNKHYRKDLYHTNPVARRRMLDATLACNKRRRLARARRSS